VDDLQLNNLLHRVDEAAELPMAMPGLATRVRTAARRRKNTRRTVVSLGLLALTVGVIAWLEHPTQHQQQFVRVDPKVNVQQIRVELAEFQEQAKQHMLVAEHLLQDEKEAHQRRRIERLSLVPDAQVVVESQRDQAAQILVDRAKRLQRNRDIEQATTAYQRVIELFPTTPAAQTARQCLDNLKA
jgi:hypothetical protein